MLVQCMNCNFWSKEDLEADDDVVQVGRDDTKTAADLLVKKEVEPDMESEQATSAMLTNVPVLSGDQVTVASDDEAPIRPETGAVIALPEAESVKRAADLLTQGGLLLTEWRGNGQKIIRRLELDEKKGVVSWSIDRVLGIFGDPFVKIDLRTSRVMCTGKLVKIGAAGKRDFFTFEACDADEAGAVCDCLVVAAKNLKEGRIV